uniref:Uncharacterized protein n=1 Tax=Magnetococcus massalia (strain MO-1) TaxID=451514 RepID=A0A1S7LEJ2_MAGMO|nr:Exported protein of unknown function [Candidatus Magnetococcus massalia]
MTQRWTQFLALLVAAMPGTLLAHTGEHAHAGFFHQIVEHPLGMVLVMALAIGGVVLGIKGLKGFVARRQRS